MKETLMRSMVFHDFAVNIERLVELGVTQNTLRRVFEAGLAEAMEKNLIMCPHCGAVQEPNDEQ